MEPGTPAPSPGTVAEKNDPPPHLRNAPEQREMALIAGLALFLNVFPGSFLQAWHLRWGLLISQVLFIAGPALLAPRWFYLDRRAVLPLGRPRPRVLAAAALGTVGLNHLLTAYGSWQEGFAPEPEWIRALFDSLLAFDGPLDLLLVLLVVAVVPAICEEFLFRGFLQSGLVRAFESAPKGIAFTAMVFGAFHILPWRIPLLVVMGLFLGYVAHRGGSLLPAMLAHALNNTLSIVLPLLPPASRPALEGTPLTVAAGALLVAGSMVLLHRAAPGGDAARVL
jgi:sodium transport system permease protein